MNKYFCSNRSEIYKFRVHKIIENKKLEIFDFFNIDKNTELNINIYIYDTIEKLVEGMKDRGFKDMPDYMCACQKDEDNSLNLFEPKDNPSDNEYTKDKYDNVIFHELIHSIQYMIYGSQPEWLTEGVAKYLDGTYQNDIDWLLENYINQNRIPSMYELEHEFGNHEYDSYDYAYIMVSYLIEILGKDIFIKIISNKEQLNKISNNLVEKAINYYNDKFKNNLLKL